MSVPRFAERLKAISCAALEDMLRPTGTRARVNAPGSGLSRFRARRTTTTGTGARNRTPSTSGEITSSPSDWSSAPSPMAPNPRRASEMIASTGSGWRMLRFSISRPWSTFSSGR